MRGLARYFDVRSPHCYAVEPVLAYFLKKYQETRKRGICPWTSAVIRRQHAFERRTRPPILCQAREPAFVTREALFRRSRRRERGAIRWGGVAPFEMKSPAAWPEHMGIKLAQRARF
jgi:hypothetical protein